MSKSILIFLIYLLTVCTAFNGNLGLQLGFTGGPYLALTGGYNLTETITIDIVAGGFPGIVSKIESNLKFNTNWKYPHYIRVGIGNFAFFRGQGDGHSLTEFHFSGGITRTRGKFNLSTEIGSVYIPPFKANDWRETMDDYNPSPIPIVPMLAFQFSYPL